MKLQLQVEKLAYPDLMSASNSCDAYGSYLSEISKEINLSLEKTYAAKNLSSIYNNPVGTAF